MLDGTPQAGAGGAQRGRGGRRRWVRGPLAVVVGGLVAGGLVVASGRGEPAAVPGGGRGADAALPGGIPLSSSPPRSELAASAAAGAASGAAAGSTSTPAPGAGAPGAPALDVPGAARDGNPAAEAAAAGADAIEPATHAPAAAAVAIEPATHAPAAAAVARDVGAAQGAGGTVQAGPAAGAERHDFGISVAGRPLTAWRRAGSSQPSRRELVVGVIHGEEPAGRAVADALLGAALPADLELWVVPTLNPDGEAVGQRGNANGVDLNRNFPTGWLPPDSHPYTSGGYHSGAGPASEPEVQSAMALIRSIRPHRTVWYHQPWDEVICEIAHAGRACTDYAARVGRPAGPAGRPGSAIGWQEAENLGAALVVELAEGPPGAETVQLHAAAVLAGW